MGAVLGAALCGWCSMRRGYCIAGKLQPRYPIKDHETSVTSKTLFFSTLRFRVLVTNRSTSVILVIVKFLPYIYTNLVRLMYLPL